MIELCLIRSYALSDIILMNECYSDARSAVEIITCAGA